ncbi:uncharacterized protein [Diabrotica undecimpunctata]|uniref:uncharacterized protein isoform X4 n=1 Tax=Diabrotica undecimpunctata TaxID=50387 RepID=UPI003B635552
MMEVKQEASEIPYKTEVYNNFSDGLSLLDNVKIEIKEEPKIENANDTFDYVDLKEYSIKTDAVQDEDKLSMSHEEQTKEGGFLGIYMKTDAQNSLNDCVRSNKNLNQYLNASTKVNADETSFACEICNKQFSQSYNLKRHKRIHTEEKSFTCEICSKKFLRSTNLKSIVVGSIEYTKHLKWLVVLHAIGSENTADNKR